MASFNLSFIKTDKIMDLPSLFSNCQKLDSFDISNLYTPNVINME